MKVQVTAPYRSPRPPSEQQEAPGRGVNDQENPAPEAPHAVLPLRAAVVTPHPEPDRPHHPRPPRPHRVPVAATRPRTAGPARAGPSAQGRDLRRTRSGFSDQPDHGLALRPRNHALARPAGTHPEAGATPCTPQGVGVCDRRGHSPGLRSGGSRQALLLGQTSAAR